jgi:hypothetical protein
VKAGEMATARRLLLNGTLPFAAVPLLFSLADPLQLWREKHKFATRYEGPVTELVGVPNLELLSFTRSISPFPKNTNIHIRYFQPPGKRVVIVVRGKGDHSSYRMETVPTESIQLWPVFTDWPSKTYLDDRIGADEIGAVGYVVEGSALPGGGSKQVVPIDVFPAGKKTPPADHYTVVVKSNASLKKFTASVEDATGKKQILDTRWVQPRARIPFEFTIPYSALGSNGLCRLRMEGRRYSPPYDPAIAEIMFSHPKS